MRKSSKKCKIKFKFCNCLMYETYYGKHCFGTFGKNEIYKKSAPLIINSNNQCFFSRSP